MNHPSPSHQSFPKAHAGLTPCDIDSMHRQARALAPVLRRQAIDQFWAAVGQGTRRWMGRLVPQVVRAALK